MACRAPVDEEYLQWAQMPYTAEDTGLLGEGDRFSLRVYQEAEMDADYTVSALGVVNFPLIGEVAVINRDCISIEREVTARLADGFLRSPSVSCQILEVNSRTFVVSGEAGNPGVYPFTPRLTLVQAMAMAGGMTNSAAKDRLVITRLVDGEFTEIVVPFQQVLSGRGPDLPVWPNDSIFVPTYRLIP